jgi:hypothetical protein
MGAAMRLTACVLTLAAASYSLLFVGGHQRSTVSVLVIPADAGAGYYNLTTSIDAHGGQMSGGA